MASHLDQKNPSGSPLPNGYTLLSYSPDDVILGRRRREPCTPKRFFKALLMAGGAFFVLSTLAHGTFFCAKRWSVHSVIPNHWDENPIPDDVALSHCASSDDWEVEDRVTDFDWKLRFPYQSTTHFDIPLAPDTLWFVTKGISSVGSLNIVTSPDQPKDKITYYVTAHYYKEEVRDLADVCIITKKDNENQEGVGIFTSRHGEPRRRRENRLSFETTIVFPESDDGSALLIKDFVADTFITRIQTSSLAEKIIFKNISLQGYLAPIKFSLRAVEGTISTSNAPIEGYFNTTGNLELITRNANIKVDIVATSVKNGSEPKVILETVNAPIEGSFHLVSAEGANGTFHVTAKTRNSPLKVKFEDAPADAILVFNAETANSPAEVALHPTFEGSFLAETSTFFQAKVLYDQDEEDPIGKERQRQVLFEGKNNGQTKQGYVFWGDQEKEKLKGRVTVKTSLSPVELQL
ncbi:hypothetical protein CPB83DRAFT_651900 [Crepidotus variabilis]|uniref:Uncharacterized protein n=1 Tax=Crepidotus variabilis TaxID=179855 RepID=A0A9P6E7F5_9AGAR|nr:hypothetical protein CPB83DRAFT_651900 [Crepidotus variabilis]